MDLIYKCLSLLEEIGTSSTEAERLKKLESLLEGEFLAENVRDIEDYRKREKHNIAEEFALKRAQFLFMIKFWSELAEFIGVEWHASINKDETQYRINTTFKLYHKAIQTCIDNLALFENGALISTFILWRTIYESFIISMYLLQETEITSQRFNDHAESDYYYFLRLAKRDIGKQHMKKIEKLKRKYDKSFFKPFGWINPESSIKGFSDILKHVKEKEFPTWYKYSSAIVHSSSFSVNKRIFSDSDLQHDNRNMIGIYWKGVEVPYTLVLKVMRKFTEMLIDFFLEKFIYKDALSVINEVLCKNAEMGPST